MVALIDSVLAIRQAWICTVKAPSSVSASPIGDAPADYADSLTQRGAATRHSRLAFFARETSISLVVNVFMAVAATRLLSNYGLATDGRFADAFIDIALASSGAMVGIVVPVTLGVRGRVRRGQAAPMVGPPLGPANVLLRTVLLCLVAPLLLGLPVAWLLAALTPRGADFLIFKAVYVGIIALTVTPIVIVAALRDR